MRDRKPYFPFFMDITGANGLIIGGDRHAYQKVEKMKPYGCRLTVIAESFAPEFEKVKDVFLVKRHFQEEDFCPEPDFVIVSDIEEGEKQWIYNFCTSRHIPLNAIDDQPYCTYIYPALIEKGDLSIGVATGGTSPAAAAILKEKILDLIPEHIDDILDYLMDLRPMMKERIQDSKKRGKVLRKIANICMERDEVFSEEELRNIIDCID